VRLDFVVTKPVRHNFNYHSQQLMELLALLQKADGNERIYRHAMLLQLTRIFEHLARISKNLPIFQDWRDILRHASDQIDLVSLINDVVVPICSSLQAKPAPTSLGRLHEMTHIKFAIDAQLMQELDQRRQPFLPQLRKYEVGNDTLPVREQEIDTLLQELLTIRASDLPEAIKRDASLMIMSLIGEVHREGYAGWMFGQIGHHGFEEFYELFANGHYQRLQQLSPKQLQRGYHAAQHRMPSAGIRSGFSPQ
jgi:hypothetical protein